MTMTRDEDPQDPIPFVVAKATERLKLGCPVTTGERPSMRVLHSGESCNHLGGILEIDERSRIVECSICKTHIDPFDALTMIANGERRMQQQVDIIQREQQHGRNFYAQKNTLEAQRCRHKHTYPATGGRKCLRCETFIPNEIAGRVSGAPA